MANPKRAAAAAALELVEPGMRLGLGTGSTAAEFVDLLGARVRDGLNVVGVPTSVATEEQARVLGIPLTTLDDTPQLDLTIDGADEIDGRLRLIKGGGGALLREKIVAASSRRMAVIADGSKRIETLGAFALPVEIVPFGHAATIARVERAAAASGCHGNMVLRSRDGDAFMTDNGNLIYDCHFGTIVDPEALAAALAATPGVVEHGLFIDLADVAFIAGQNGVTKMEAAAPQ